MSRDPANRWFARDVTVDHVGGQEQKHFALLGTKLYFHVNSSRKKSYWFDPQHNRLVTRLQTKSSEMGAGDFVT